MSWVPRGVLMSPIIMFAPSEAQCFEQDAPNPEAPPV